MGQQRPRGGNAWPSAKGLPTGTASDLREAREISARSGPRWYSKRLPPRLSLVDRTECVSSRAPPQHSRNVLQQGPRLSVDTEALPTNALFVPQRAGHPPIRRDVRPLPGAQDLLESSFQPLGKVGAGGRCCGRNGQGGVEI